MANRVHLDPILAASWRSKHTSGAADLASGRGPTAVEVPCGLRMSILHDVRSGIEGYGGEGGMRFPSDPRELGQGREIYI